MFVALVFFLLIGLFITGLLIHLGVTHFGGYFVSVSFILFPILLFYEMKYGFSISEKTMLDIEKRKDKFSFDENGITFVRSIFDVTLNTKYSNIKDITYQMCDDYNEYIFYLNDFAEVKYHENPWFMNRIFPYKNNRKEIYIKNDSKGFNQVSIMKAKHLPHLTLKK